MPVSTQVKRVVRVEKMTGRTGRPVKNQYVIHTPEGRYFQSYAAMVAFQDHLNTTTLLDKRYWRYSRTTMKYLEQFLGQGMKQIIEHVESGYYRLVDRLMD